MKRMRGGSGLGDSLYLRPLVDYFARHGDPVRVLTFYPDVFIGANCKVAPFDKSNIDVLAHYAHARKDQSTTQYADILRSAGTPADVPLRFDWTVRNRALVASLRKKARGRKIILVHGGRAAFGRTDGVGREIVPRGPGFVATLEAMSDCFRVRIGKGEQFYGLPVDLDLNDSTTVSDLLDIGTVCDGVVTQCGFPVPLAECFDKPLLAVWSMRGLVSIQPIIATITPAKILSKASSRYLMDEWEPDRIKDAARAFTDSLAPAEALA